MSLVTEQIRMTVGKDCSHHGNSNKVESLLHATVLVQLATVTVLLVTEADGRVTVSRQAEVIAFFHWVETMRSAPHTDSKSTISRGGSILFDLVRPAQLDGTPVKARTDTMATSTKHKMTSKHMLHTSHAVRLDRRWVWMTRSDREVYTNMMAT